VNNEATGIDQVLPAQNVNVIDFIDDISVQLKTPFVIVFAILTLVKAVEI
jgi:hypothetical protein